MGTRFGDEVKRRMEQEGLNGQAVADAVGVDRQTIGDITRGKTDNPHAKTVFGLCRILDMTPNEAASYFGMWHGKSLENDQIDRQLAMTLANLEAIATSLDRDGQWLLDSLLSAIVGTYNPHGKTKRVLIPR